MKLRKIPTINVKLLSKFGVKEGPVEIVYPHALEKKPYTKYLWMALGIFLVASYIYFGFIRDNLTTMIHTINDYFTYCVIELINMPFWKLILLFLPALLFDVTRYYLSNTIMFFVEIFTLGLMDEGDDPNWSPLVSVLVPAYNEGPRIQRALDSILASNYPNFEIIVIDDHSSDSTPAICKEYADKGLIKFARKETRGGKPSALNWGFQFAKGDIIFHFDSDIVIYPDAIKEAVKPFKDPKVGAVSGNLRVYNDRKSLAARLQAAEYGAGISLQRRWLSRTGTLYIASGAFGAFRREVLERSMGTDPEFGEDLDITLKTKKLGYKVKFAPKAIIMTAVPDTFRSLFAQRVRWDKCYIRLNLRKHGNMGNFRRFKFRDFAMIVADLFFNVVLLLVFPVYIVWIYLYAYDFFWFIVVTTFLFYTIMNLWQFIMVTILSDRPKRDCVFILYAPLFFPYSMFLRVARFTAYIIEFFRKDYMNDGYFPGEVLDNIPKYY